MKQTFPNTVRGFDKAQDLYDSLVNKGIEPEFSIEANQIIILYDNEDNEI